ncbi:hypothetical protein SARC_09450 [Sphaeroforma arctica JP610]|uniref:Uncharacterized protein n=1 Tax=Sphaeroforma arctica JP610 TaxID=667725 RepID=A0A0L0FMY2_9EUKA|nr:hypothetical protein SARC_09450 [Sphaeroforma arctica JP610]KNC78099.1 hypothetical protein SARC_09450 [Sphaeroforma arctica JP610]|eukprot:XP_014152001.1 hypothetical protein SARC_09450 [Sphaeroforma arctica JP610]
MARNEDIRPAMPFCTQRRACDSMLSESKNTATDDRHTFGRAAKGGSVRSPQVANNGTTNRPNRRSDASIRGRSLARECRSCGTTVPASGFPLDGDVCLSCRTRSNQESQSDSVAKTISAPVDSPPQSTTPTFDPQAGQADQTDSVCELCSTPSNNLFIGTRGTRTCMACISVRRSGLSSTSRRPRRTRRQRALTPPPQRAQAVRSLLRSDSQADRECVVCHVTRPTNEFRCDEIICFSCVSYEAGITRDTDPPMRLCELCSELLPVFRFRDNGHTCRGCLQSTGDVDSIVPLHERFRRLGMLEGQADPFSRHQGTAELWQGTWMFFMQ